MRLTLLRAKEALAHKSPEDKLEHRLNRISERYLLHGKFVGSLQRLALAAPYGQLSLPRQFRTVEGVKVNGVVRELANDFWDFLPGKSNAFGYSLDEVRDLGDGWAIMRTPQPLATDPLPTMSTPLPDFPAGVGTISIDYSGSETLVVTISGRDANEGPVELEFSGKETKSNPFARISRVHKEQGDVAVSVIFTHTDATATTLAIMEPTEEETYYRRYMIDSQRNNPDAIVAAFCKRRHIEFTSDADVLPFSNVSALELGFDALQYEAEGDIPLADSYWERGVDILNKELGDTKSDNEVPVIQFLYPGRTKPQFSSHY